MLFKLETSIKMERRSLGASLMLERYDLQDEMIVSANPRIAMTLAAMLKGSMFRRAIAISWDFFVARWSMRLRRSS